MRSGSIDAVAAAAASDAVYDAEYVYACEISWIPR